MRRREYAHCFAQTALGVIEKDYELLSMSQNSQTGLANTTRLEVPLEGVVTLSMLSIYEYAQRGNIDGMLQRANQALALAMSMALHEAVEEEPYADSKRRVWWMTVGLL
ncbi:C6 finger domain protein, putative [Aspergillus oryzae 100-8]|uniref:C6 finger domain protein, putative n=1 Tax=Aspergillus oryzae (strain 3.042) TaxID=1160506 RepID=I8TIT6_ASPO3|nr:C6 finger domain protein, putative [Aspergillus oryzae 3.042]KDE78389.1 C6 finger domain protein, putative [Aspergillus oryzae 100-8]|eukprot:EIT73945.1 C6 finger domain protein, putative [Aspergillus oryzae 3.042]